jgi:predicted MFS family arabinose efflux permease
MGSEPNNSAGQADETRTDQSGTAAEGMSRVLVVVLAVAVGAAVANRYYIEPLLNLISRQFGCSNTAAGLLVSCAQFGYVVGVVLLVPLGDLIERRRLVTIMLLGAGVAAATCAAAPNLAVLAAALAVLGLLSVTAQILIPLAADLAAPRQRGQVVGTVTSGLLMGILGARTVSGLAAGLGGSRLIFALAAAAMLALSAVLSWVLPSSTAPERGSYRRLLASVVDLVATEPVLRQRMILGFLQMAGFTVLWTPSAFLLAGAPYHYGPATIGLFGLVGVAGALTAPMAGRLADRGLGRAALTTSLIVMLGSWGLLAVGRTSLVALIAGIALLDLGVQGAQVNHQSVIYALKPLARSRVNTAYMGAFVLGGVFGSLLAATVYGAGGWYASCLLGAGIAATALAVWAVTSRIGDAVTSRIGDSASASGL